MPYRRGLVKANCKLGHRANLIWFCEVKVEVILSIKNSRFRVFLPVLGCENKKGYFFRYQKVLLSVIIEDRHMGKLAVAANVLM